MQHPQQLHLPEVWRRLLPRPLSMEHLLMEPHQLHRQLAQQNRQLVQQNRQLVQE